MNQTIRVVLLGALGIGAMALTIQAIDVRTSSSPAPAELEASVDETFADDAEAPVPVRIASVDDANDLSEDDDSLTAPILRVRPITPDPSPGGSPRSAALPPYSLVIPVEGVDVDDLFDSYGDARGEERRHLAIDILAPTGTPVLASAAGEVVRMHHSPRGGITLYIVDQAGEYIYYYAHLDGYAEGLSEGDRVQQGELIGYVGHTGNADAGTPHLHFAIWKKRPGRSFWGGSPVNPYLALTR